MGGRVCFPLRLSTHQALQLSAYSSIQQYTSVYISAHRYTLVYSSTEPTILASIAALGTVT